MNIAALFPVIALLTIIIVFRKDLRLEPLSPRSIFIATFSIFYLIDYIFATTYYTNQIYLSGYVFHLDSKAEIYLIIYYISVSMIALIALRSDSGNLSKTTLWLNGLSKIGRESTVYVSIFLNTICIAFLFYIISSVGLSSYFVNLSLRSTLFSETTIINALASASITFSGIVLSAYSITRKNSKLILSLSIVLILILAALMAARAALVELVFIYYFIRHQSGIRLKINLKHVAYISISMIILVELAFQTRVTADGDQLGLLRRIFLTEQIPQAENGLIYLSNSTNLNSTSILTSLVSWVPRDILEFVGVDKGQGGNADFTGAYLPHRWYDQNSQISLGGVNEFLVNFGIAAGLPLAFFWFYFVNLAYKKIISNKTWFLLSIPIAWSVFQILRGDLYHTINKAAISIFIIVMIIIISKLNLTIKRNT